MHKILAFYFFLSFMAAKLVAQDVHYSQFIFAPLQHAAVSPALSEASHLFYGNYKNQWRYNSLVPYNTYSLAYQNNQFLKKSGTLSYGVRLQHDVAGDANFTTDQLQLNTAYAIRLTTKHKLAFGFSYGYFQRRFDINFLNFSSQYDDIQFNPLLPTLEDFESSSNSFHDLSSSLGYQFRSDKFQLSFTQGIFHINQPDQSFNQAENAKLAMRFSSLIQASYTLARIAVQPAVNLQQQESKREILYGFNLYQKIGSDFPNRSLIYGAWYRQSDAPLLLLGMEYNYWRVALSYDINTSQLVPASGYRGSTELSISYRIYQVKDLDIKAKACEIY